jgi:xanthine dehydrogenase YagT iron-sulfur-binding subunit
MLFESASVEGGPVDELLDVTVEQAVGWYLAAGLAYALLTTVSVQGQQQRLNPRKPDERVITLQVRGSRVRHVTVRKVYSMPLSFADQLEIELRVNGHEVRTVVSPRTTLLDWLREEAGLTGAKKGCNEGACGTCTVLVDGRRMNGCLTLVVQCQGLEITTVEGLAEDDGTLSPVQQAFRDHDGFQCGYCTPGQLLSATACIAEGHAVDEATVREWMSGNICRCSAYPQITAAVLAAAEAMGTR